MTFALIWLQVGTGGVATIRLEDLNPLPVTCKTNYFIGCIWLRQCSKPRGWLTHTVFNLQHGSSSTSPHTSSFILCKGVWWASSKSAQLEKNMYTIIIIQSSSALTKRPSRFCRASVSHVARFLLYSLLFTAPDERGKGRIGASELRKTRGRPGKAFLRKRQQCPRQKGSSSGRRT